MAIQLQLNGKAPRRLLHSSTNQTWKIVKIYVYIR
ncbi:hypothetical protein LMED105_12517 [Limnobacter sp. MED105]|nr:hypothetical protein LMED105_12517 [Limnobacter sp. MED105]